MFKKFVIITTASLVCACADGEPEQEEQTEQTTQTQQNIITPQPETPALTYKWSHPNCPYTVNFPGKPEEEVVEKELNVVSIDLSYMTYEMSFKFNCSYGGSNLVSYLKQNTKLKIAKSYPENLRANPRYNNVKSKLIEQTPYKNIINSVLYFSFNSKKPNYTIQTNTIILINDNTIADINVLYKSEEPNMTAGSPFFQSVKLKK